jgi:hypothetical protein
MVPAASAVPPPVATVQFTINGTPVGPLSTAPAGANASDTTFNGTATVALLKSGVNQGSGSNPYGCCTWGVFTGFASQPIFGCYWDNNATVTAVGPAPCPALGTGFGGLFPGVNGANLSTTGQIRQFVWQSCSTTTISCTTITSLPVPYRANGVVFAFTTTTPGTSVPEFPSFSYLIMAVALSFIVLAYAKRHRQFGVAA